MSRYRGGIERPHRRAAHRLVLLMSICVAGTLLAGCGPDASDTTKTSPTSGTPATVGDLPTIPPQASTTIDDVDPVPVFPDPTTTTTAPPVPTSIVAPVTTPPPAPLAVPTSSTTAPPSALCTKLPELPQAEVTLVTTFSDSTVSTASLGATGRTIADVLRRLRPMAPAATQKLIDGQVAAANTAMNNIASSPDRETAGRYLDGYFVANRTRADAIVKAIQAKCPGTSLSVLTPQPLGTYEGIGRQMDAAAAPPATDPPPADGSGG